MMRPSERIDVVRQLRSRLEAIEDALSRRLDDASEGATAWAVQAIGDANDEDGQSFRVVELGGPAEAGQEVTVKSTPDRIPAERTRILGPNLEDGDLGLAVFASGLWTIL